MARGVAQELLGAAQIGQAEYFFNSLPSTICLLHWGPGTKGNPGGLNCIRPRLGIKLGASRNTD